MTLEAEEGLQGVDGHGDGKDGEEWKKAVPSGERPNGIEQIEGKLGADDHLERHSRVVLEHGESHHRHVNHGVVGGDHGVREFVINHEEDGDDHADVIRADVREGASFGGGSGDARVDAIDAVQENAGEQKTGRQARAGEKKPRVGHEQEQAEEGDVIRRHAEAAQRFDKGADPTGTRLSERRLAFPLQIREVVEAPHNASR